MELVDAARDSPSHATSMHQPQTLRERKLESVLQMLKAQLDVTDSGASLEQHFVEWQIVDCCRLMLRKDFEEERRQVEEEDLQDDGKKRRSTRRLGRAWPRQRAPRPARE